MKILYDEALEQPPTAERLRAMITALASGAAISILRQSRRYYDCWPLKGA
jgi:hypothetical protein